MACGSAQAIVVGDTTGQLTVTIDGLPAGTPATVAVSGAALQRTVTASETIAALAPGAYSVHAAPVSAGAGQYVPSPPDQTVNVTAGATARAAVVYAPTSPYGDLPPGFLARTLIVGNVSYKYQVFIPEGYTPTRRWPVILFLHGSDESGVDGEKQVTVGLGPYVRANAASFPAVVVFPQVPALQGGGSLIQLADAINRTALDMTLAEVNADSTRIYLTGLSQGAYLAWDQAFEAPDFFAAMVPIAGGICAACIAPGAGLSQDSVVALVAQSLRMLPIWMFHGDADPLDPVAGDRAILAVFQALGSPIRYTEFAGRGHNVWDTAYADPATWTWLFAQHR